MAADADQIVSEALKLSADERADIADRLLRSLDEEEGDDLDDEDRERLHAAINLSAEQYRAGDTVPAKVVLDQLRKC
jgi:hypothetical protein